MNNTAKRRKLIVSWIMILVMLFSNIGIVMAAELVGLNNPPIITTETVIDGQPVVTVEAELADDSNIMPITEGAYFNPTEFVNEATTPETYGEVYNRIIAMQEHYPEGLTWTNYVPYGNGPLGSSYTWWKNRRKCHKWCRLCSLYFHLERHRFRHFARKDNQRWHFRF